MLWLPSPSGRPRPRGRWASHFQSRAEPLLAGMPCDGFDFGCAEASATEVDEPAGWGVGQVRRESAARRTACSRVPLLRVPYSVLWGTDVQRRLAADAEGETTDSTPHDEPPSSGEKAAWRSAARVLP